MLMKYWQCLGLFLIVSLVGCGGGGGSAPTSGGGGGSDVNPTGIWINSGESNEVLLLAVIDVDKSSLFYLPLGDSMFICDAQVNGTKFECTSNDGFSVQGQIETDGLFSVSYFIDGAEQSSYILTETLVYDQSIGLADLEGFWSVTEVNITETIQVDGEGGISGSDSSGCVLAGQVNTLDDQKNIQNVVIEYSNCGEKNGNYSGKAIVFQAIVLNEPTEAWWILTVGDEFNKESVYLVQ